MPELLPRFHRRELEARDRQAVARALASSGEAIEVEPVRPGAGMHADPLRARGVPIVGSGAGGAIRGSDPARETLRRAAKRGR